jgi:hypothetical protein
MWGCVLGVVLGCAQPLTWHHHHQITKLSHSINAIGPAPQRSGRKREHRSIVFATITDVAMLCVFASIVLQVPNH